MIELVKELFFAGLLQGLILAFVALGAMIPFRLLNLADLTPEGSYPLGGALSACLLIYGLHPVLATSLAFLVGGLIGLATSLIYLRLKVNTLLAGIILSAMLYSVDLRLMGKPNVALFDQANVFAYFGDQQISKICFLLCLNGIVLLILYAFLKSEKGLRLRAAGLNTSFAQKQGINVSAYVCLGLFLGNAFASLAGSLMVQNQRYADVGIGVGIVIHALAAIMIGESFVDAKGIKGIILAPLVGALVYQQIQGLAMSLGLAPSDLKLVTGLIVLSALGYRQWRTSKLSFTASS